MIVTRNVIVGILTITTNKSPLRHAPRNKVGASFNFNKSDKLCPEYLWSASEILSLP